ncbi:MAG: hypothetical protein JXB42_01755 [Deltaproteobacteria bacterium]|nr:hypothetical protein [Deltaproteobacteria bacterium]
MTSEMACMLGIIGSLLIFILGVLSWQVRSFRKELNDFSGSIYRVLERKTDKKEFEKVRDDLWRHVHGHKHNGDGRVVIMTPGG